MSGTYYVLIKDASGIYTGNYSLTLTKPLGPQAADPNGDDGELLSGATHIGTITLGDIDRYTVNLTTGNPYNLVVTDTSGGNLYPYIALYRPDGTLFASTSGPTTAVLTNTAPVSGTFYVVIRDASFYYTGSYSLLLTK